MPIRIEVDETFPDRLSSSGEAKCHACVEQSTSNIFMYGEVKFLMMLLNVSMIHKGQWVERFDEKQSHCSFLV
jgi:hypothetical protein